MNKKLLDTRIKSIEHYNQQIADLQATLKEVTDVKKQVVRSLEEFCPFTEGDIICYKDEAIRKFRHVYSVSESSTNGLTLNFNAYRDGNYGELSRETSGEYQFAHPDDWTILKHAKPKEAADGQG